MKNKQVMGRSSDNAVAFVFSAIVCFIVFSAVWANVKETHYLIAVLRFFALPVLLYPMIVLLAFLGSREKFLRYRTDVANPLRLVIAFYSSLFINRAKVWMFTNPIWKFKSSKPEADTDN